ncbi:hypothetical protein DM02DRAFT_396319 [Periconia macrospinosa]|uniref:Uncharacterized protein n=1 Tax=Periconia macrospinosa TaxID=97972 RepID=A0A2V1DQ81_9PLEO|nr:hypothetical protein DM02DRAFT_396319 [Periconia macrospinosa]
MLSNVCDEKSRDFVSEFVILMGILGIPRYLSRDMLFSHTTTRNIVCSRRLSSPSIVCKRLSHEDYVPGSTYLTDRDHLGSGNEFM